MPRRFAPLLAFTLLISCSARPDLSAAGSAHDATAPWPELLPRDALETATQEPRARPSVTALGARAAALTARARALSTRPVLSNAERNRLSTAIAENRDR